MITEQEFNTLPESSGVYIFRDKEKNIIYIGKAKNIKERVRSYMAETKRDIKTERLVDKIEEVEVFLTKNEKEAFLLENNLIKENRPRYNVNLKDDKSYISLKLTVNDRHPALYLTREIEDDGALYFGPYPRSRDVKDVLKLIQNFYAIRRCKDSVFKKRKRPCILFQLGKCPGPCTEKIDDTGYRNMVSELADFLSGRSENLLKELERRITRAISSWKFEEAQALKERYLAIKGMMERQSVHEHLGKDRDVWAFSGGDQKVHIVLLSFKKGVLIAKKTFREPSVATTLHEIIPTFLFQYYNLRPVPEEIIASEKIRDAELLETYLRDKKNGPVRIYGPDEGAAGEIMRLALENLHETEPIPKEEAFKKTLHLKRIPGRIEIYDISHSHGKHPTGVMVVFEKFKAAKRSYRVFHIKEAPSMDDVAMIGETLQRRLTDTRIVPLPDLCIIDGGKGQLSAAMKILKSLNINSDVIGVAKGQRRKKMEDLIYIPLRKNPLLLSKSSIVFREILRLRDEAHRFAVTSHRRWKKREDLL
ncbi:MAG: excinuclease ABC subunit UvrC [Syntrophorhabdaceae bacterium]|nr:excinuclease ABC subunit UvrC [Syntrophorhabdaceae bacterium]